MRLFVLIIIGVIVAVMVYVRLAPADVDAVHVQAAPRMPDNYPSKGGFIAVREMTAPPEDVLRALASIALRNDRTKTLAGSVDEGIITFVSRSKLFGFPDYTTVSIIPAGTVSRQDGSADGQSQLGALLMIDGHLRYGQSDMGVNKTRIERWLSALGPLTVALEQDSPST